MDVIKFKWIVTLVSVSVFTVGSAHNSHYREKYSTVLNHYKATASDSLKYRAALFLIDNMDGHRSPKGKGIAHYTDKIKSLNQQADFKILSQLWSNNNFTSETILVDDSMQIGNDMLIKNIDEAFSNWECAPWKNDISFELFCKYILPYKAKEEYLVHDWRNVLREKYHKRIEGITDIKRAFAIIQEIVKEKVQITKSYTPYTLDVLSYEHILKATCEQRCILLTCILRSLGIPVAIDYIDVWADYSTRGHAWVSLIMNDGLTYTVYEDEDEVKRYNKIDASEFKVRYEIKKEDHCPYQIKRKKNISKIYRRGYQRSGLFGKTDPRRLSDPFAIDVSAEYGLNAKLEFPAYDDDPVYLCTFLTGKDWIPIAKQYPINGKVVFEHVGSNIVCLPAQIYGKRYIPTSQPVLVGENGIKKMFNASGTNVQSIIINRKYPLCEYMPGQWQYLIGTCFEGSNSLDFSNPDTLACILTMPYKTTEIKVKNKKKFRFLRYKSLSGKKGILSELAFYSEKGHQEIRLNGEYVSGHAEDNTVKNLFDNNRDTKIKSRAPGIWAGIDLGQGNASNVSRIVFSPVSDTNDVEIGHDYELYYFDKKWKLIAKQKAVAEHLIFDNVPVGSLLLLKDKTKGKEERIFEYINNLQVWY